MFAGCDIEGPSTILGTGRLKRQIHFRRPRSGFTICDDTGWRTPGTNELLFCPSTGSVHPPTETYITYTKYLAVLAAHPAYSTTDCKPSSKNLSKIAFTSAARSRCN
jgi:hypothetical protein